MKFSKAQILKIIQSGGFLGRIIGGLPLAKYILQSLTKSVLIPLGSAASAAICRLHKARSIKKSRV